MNIDFSKLNFMDEILDGTNLQGAARKGLRKSILRKSPAEVVAICAENGFEIVDVTPLETNLTLGTIKKEFDALLAEGVEVLPGIVMKCDFDDALVVRESATFKQEAGLTTMTLKDVNGTIHRDIDLADVLSTVVPVMAQRYAYLWETKEEQLDTVKNFSTQEEVDSFVITW